MTDSTDPVGGKFGDGEALPPEIRRTQIVSTDVGWLQRLAAYVARLKDIRGQGSPQRSMGRAAVNGKWDSKWNDHGTHALVASLPMPNIATESR